MTPALPPAELFTFSSGCSALSNIRQASTQVGRYLKPLSQTHVYMLGTTFRLLMSAVARSHFFLSKSKGAFMIYA